MKDTESFIRFEKHARWLGQRRLTDIWDVVEVGGGEPLGEVRWFAKWRCYAFFPDGTAVFEHRCLRDIANFCQAETLRHRTARKAEVKR